MDVSLFANKLFICQRHSTEETILWQQQTIMERCKVQNNKNNLLSLLFKVTQRDYSYLLKAEPLLNLYLYSLHILKRNSPTFRMLVSGCSFLDARFPKIKPLYISKTCFQFKCCKPECKGQPTQYWIMHTGHNYILCINVK